MIESTTKVTRVITFIFTTLVKIGSDKIDMFFISSEVISYKFTIISARALRDEMVVRTTDQALLQSWSAIVNSMTPSFLAIMAI